MEPCVCEACDGIRSISRSLAFARHCDWNYQWNIKAGIAIRAMRWRKPPVGKAVIAKYERLTHLTRPLTPAAADCRDGDRPYLPLSCVAELSAHQPINTMLCPTKRGSHAIWRNAPPWGRLFEEIRSSSGEGSSILCDSREHRNHHSSTTIPFTEENFLKSSTPHPWEASSREILLYHQLRRKWAIFRTKGSREAAGVHHFSILPFYLYFCSLYFVIAY